MMKRTTTWISCVLLGACAGPAADEPAKAPTTRETPKQPTSKPMAGVTDAAVGKKVMSDAAPNDQYAAAGIDSLVDGRMGSNDYMDPEWMGWWYEDKPFAATIDLGKATPIHTLGVHTLTASEFWIFYPKKVEFEISMDGKAFEKVATVAPKKADLEKEYPETMLLKASNVNKTARYVRVRAERFGELPQWHAGHGGADGYDGEAWLFIDEILVNPK